MKKIIITLFSFILVQSLWAQLNVYVNTTTRDSVISTPFDTLSILNDKNGKPVLFDKVVGIRNVHKKVSSYWLFFYFLPTEVSKGQPISIRQGNYAYFVMDKGTYLRFPYSGRRFTYKYPEMAGFFVDVSNYVEQLSHARFNFIRLETSDLYHEINLQNSGSNKIAAILQSLQ